jgi:AcrR family transcriptional regulator
MAVAEPRTGECRPRIVGAREEEILDATLTQLLEVGYDRLTLDRVAEHAHASKATLYRRWAGKQSLVVDALTRSHRAAQLPRPDTGTLRGDLVALFTGAGGLASQMSTGILGVVVTALQIDPDFAEEFRAKFLAPKSAVMRDIYRRAADRGELSPDADPALLGPALAGILLHRALLLGEPITPPLVERVVDQIILPAATGCDNPRPPQETS